MIGKYNPPIRICIRHRAMKAGDHRGSFGNSEGPGGGRGAGGQLAQRGRHASPGAVTARDVGVECQEELVPQHTVEVAAVLGGPEGGGQKNSNTDPDISGAYKLLPK